MFTPRAASTGQDAHDADHREDRPARQGQEGPKPRPARPPDLTRVAHALGPGLALQPLVDGRLRELPHQVREQERQANVDQRAGHASPGAAGCQARQIEVPQADDHQDAGDGDHDVGRPVAGPAGSWRRTAPLRPAGPSRARRSSRRERAMSTSGMAKHDQEAQDPCPARRGGGRPAVRASRPPGDTGRRPSSGSARGRPAAGGGRSARRPGSGQRSAPGPARPCGGTPRQRGSERGSSPGGTARVACRSAGGRRPRRRSRRRSRPGSSAPR